MRGLMTTFTEDDTPGDLDVEARLVAFTTQRRDSDVVAYKDYGAGYFDNFKIKFTAEVTNNDDVDIYKNNNIEASDATTISSTTGNAGEAKFTCYDRNGDGTRVTYLNKILVGSDFA